MQTSQELLNEISALLKAHNLDRGTLFIEVSPNRWRISDDWECPHKSADGDSFYTALAEYRILLLDEIAERQSNPSSVRSLLIAGNQEKN